MGDGESDGDWVKELAQVESQDTGLGQEPFAKRKGPFTIAISYNLKNGAVEEHDRNAQGRDGYATEKEEMFQFYRVCFSDKKDLD